MHAGRACHVLACTCLEALFLAFDDTLIDGASFDLSWPFDVLIIARITVPDSGKPTFSRCVLILIVLSGDATDSNWQQRRRCFGGYDVGATEAG